MVAHQILKQSFETAHEMLYSKASLFYLWFLPISPTLGWVEGAKVLGHPVVEQGDISCSPKQTSRGTALLWLHFSFLFR